MSTKVLRNGRAVAQIQGGCLQRPDYIKVHGVREHVLVAQRALGKKLPVGAEVHHVNGDRTDNRPSNLVICNNVGYHRLLHARQRALDACGNAGWVKCKYCGQYDEPANLLTGQRTAYDAWHRDCQRTRVREFMRRKNGTRPEAYRV